MHRPSFDEFSYDDLMANLSKEAEKLDASSFRHIGHILGFHRLEKVSSAKHLSLLQAAVIDVHLVGNLDFGMVPKVKHQMRHRVCL